MTHLSGFHLKSSPLPGGLARDWVGADLHLKPDVAAADGAVTQALRGLLAVTEAYPDLKASANFLSLQEELGTTENKVSFARQFYNDNVRSLNQAVKTFPGTLFAGMAKVGAREFYVVDDPQNRQAPTVKF